MKKANLDLQRRNSSLLMKHFPQNDMKLLVQLNSVSLAICCIRSDKLKFGEFGTVQG